MVYNEEHNTIMKSTSLKVLLAIVEKQEHSVQLVQSLAQEAGYFVLLVNDYDHALEIVEDIHPDLFILDYALTGGDGIMRYQQLQANIVYKNTPVLILNTPQAKLMHEGKVLVCLAQPIQRSVLLHVVRMLLARGEQIPVGNVWNWACAQCG